MNIIQERSLYTKVHTDLLSAMVGIRLYNLDSQLRTLRAVALVSNPELFETQPVSVVELIKNIWLRNWFGGARQGFEALLPVVHQIIDAKANTQIWSGWKSTCYARLSCPSLIDKMQSRFEAAWTAAMEN